MKGVLAVLRLLLEFPTRSGREEDTDTTEVFLLHFNTDGNSSTTGNSSGVGNSSWSRRKDITNQLLDLNIHTVDMMVNY